MFINEHEEYPVVKWARYFEVSTSGYYTWLERLSEQQTKKDAFNRLVRDIFESGRGTYGAERICGIIRKRGMHASYKKVKRSMNEQNLFSVHLRHQRCLTDSRKSRGEGFSNLLKSIVITEPFQALSSDITYIPTDEGFEYTCTIRDIKTGIVLASKTADRMKKSLILDTLTSLKRCWKLPSGIVFHSDRGSQYTAKEVMRMISKMGMRQSFSRIGMPGDNSWSESFFSVMKKELIFPIGRFHTRESARQGVFQFIDGFYNTSRVQKRLGYSSPYQCLQNWSLSQ